MGRSLRLYAREALLVISIPAWLGLFALSVNDAIRDTAFPSLRVQYYDGQPYPVVLGQRAGPQTASGLQPGDKLISWGARSLADTGQHGYFAAVAAAGPASSAVVLDIERAGVRQQVRAKPESYRLFFPRVASAPVFLIVALILLYRMPRGPLRFHLVSALFAVACLFVTALSGPLWACKLAVLVQALSVSALGFCSVRAFLIFPHGELPRQRWLRALPWLFLLMGPLDIERSTGAYLSQHAAHITQFSLSNLRNGILIVSLAVNFLRATPIERRKIKWVLWGVYLAAAVPAYMHWVSLLSPGFSLQYYTLTAAAVIVPITLLIAVLRFDLFDINRILSLTAAYSIVAGVVLTSAIVLAPRVAHIVASSASLPASVAELVVSSTVVGALLLGHRHIAPVVDRFVRRGEHELALAFDSIVELLRAATSPERAMSLLAEELKRVLEPEAVALYWRCHDGWRSAVTLGCLVTVTARDSQLLEHASAQLQPIPLGNQRSSGSADPWDHALVNALGLSLAVPLSHRTGPSGVLCLGRKESGDIYLRAEIALINALCHMLSERLSFFEIDRVATGVRRFHEHLRCYVPGAVQDSLATHGTVLNGEREVTVMFVDLRGYSSLSEDHSLPALFSTISEYVTGVSAIVRKHRGHVVEFNGDGMMAVFGAIESRPDKEDAAVAAASEIVDSMRALRFGEQANRGLGIGIATGSAYVGSLRSADRSIWTAIGETTNRAARLQSLTRELDTSIIVDHKTWLSLREHADKFQRHRDKSLRGFRKRLDLFVGRDPGNLRPKRISSTSEEPASTEIS